MRTRFVVLACALGALALPAAAQADGQVKAGAAALDGTYHVGNSAGQYASTRDGGYGDYDPHVEQVKNMASYGVQARESVRALVVKGSDGKLVALVSDDHYIPQDALFKRTAQIASDMTGGALNKTNITMAVTHNHSSPSYSSFDWGVWAFQDVFDFRFFDYYAKQNARALKTALDDLHNVRVSATVSYFDKIQRNPMGPGTADDGTPAGFPKSYTDHDLSVVRFENVDDPANPRPLSTLVNLGQHPEFLNGYDLITSEYPGAMERFVDRTVGGITIFTQNATGTSEIERETYHSIHEREAFDHTQYNQMEWAARQLADAVIADVRDISAQRPNADDSPTPYGGTSYHDRFVPWMSDFPVAIQDAWFPGPVSHPYPGISSCRTDSALAGNPRIPVVGLPDCETVPIGSSLMPIVGQLPVTTPGVDTDTFESLGLPIPENYSAPSNGGLEDTLGVHLQAFRLGDILFTVCSCEQWVEQSYNVKTRTDTVPGNEWLGFDPTASFDTPLNSTNHCVQNGDGIYKDDGTGTGTWSCTPGDGKLSDRLIQRMRSRIYNDAAGWDDPKCQELGCGLQAESEPTALDKVRGNYTPDDTNVRGGKVQSADYARDRGYKLVVTISMANDYNGYIASYRDFMSQDHYRKALTGWGPHSSDYMATRMVRLGHALKGDQASEDAILAETDPNVAASKAPEYLPGATKEVADQAAEEAKVKAVGDAAGQAVTAYDMTVPDDGSGAPSDTVQPKSIERFDAATFTWVGGNNYTDNPLVTVERKVDGEWVKFADQSGEVPISVKYPASDPSGMATYRAGGQVWKWTATFEAFVSRFDLIDPQGHTYRATPPGTYRFKVHGLWHQSGAVVPYDKTSDEFQVSRWNHLTVENLALDGQRHVTFSAGPRHSFHEPRIRGTETAVLDPNGVDFAIGPVDFPDFASDQKATGFRFLNHERGYSANSPTDAEHYCLDCRFRDWLDATGDLTATVTFFTSGGTTYVEKVTTHDGEFRTDRALGTGERAEVVISDSWGDTSGDPASIGGRSAVKK
jgi:hypothetical protein